ncbi:MAG: ATP-binding cassette domain-containing protein [Chitinophagaceae bacterium]|nr:MAG: ATP-binding cassette domain-containing protein [Chitinophagaceae bacterium]
MSDLAGKDKRVLDVTGVSQKLAGEVVLDHVGFSVHEGETWAITGPSGSGKTSLARALAGQQFVQGRISYDLPDSFGDNPGILLIEQQHQFRNLSNTDSFYYQQRYNSFDSEDSQTVGQYLGSAAGDTPPDALLEKWGLASMLGKPLIQLSNGENKRLQLALAMGGHPAVMILDSPFTGLDLAGRSTLDQMISSIRESGVLVIVAGRLGELPGSVTHLLVLEKGAVLYKGPREGYTPPPVKVVTAGQQQWKTIRHEDVPDALIRMEKVSVAYGDKRVLQDINWQVRKGELWSVSGPNGAGKSTLLSLITGDNPQAYSNRIWLFDKRRGTGETIWEIKKRIGYVSPELHLSFDRGNTAAEVVASGLFDTIGLFRQTDAAQQSRVMEVLDLLGLAGIAGRPLFQLPLGQQRFVLLARALVKQPPLLVLDEPCQGLDDEQSARVKQTITDVCAGTGAALVYISHYEADIPAGVDHFLRLENGKQV